MVPVGTPAAGSCVVDIATRALRADEAAARAAATEATPSRWTAHKIDSTQRGQWAAELRSRHQVGGRRVVVLPAWPEHGRTCIGGVVHVHGAPLGNVLELMPGTVLVADAAALRGWLPGDGPLAVCDIGDDAALKARYGYSETVGNVQGFASIHLESGQAVIVKNYQTKQFQPLKEFSELARERPDRNKAQVGIGHMYLIHIWNRRASSYYVKLKVLAYVPGQYVTIRWSRL